MAAVERDRRENEPQQQDLISARIEPSGVERLQVEPQASVELLNRSAAVKLLSEVSGRVEDYDALCETLSDIKEAIMIAGAYLKNHPDQSPVELIRLLEQKARAVDYTNGATVDLSEVTVLKTQSIQPMLEVVWDGLHEDTKLLSYLISTLPMTEIYWEHIEGIKEIQVELNPELDSDNPKSLVDCREELIENGLLLELTESFYQITSVVQMLFRYKYDVSGLEQMIS